MLQTASTHCTIAPPFRLRAGDFARILTLPMVRMEERISPPQGATSSDPAAVSPGGGGTIAALDSDELHQVSGRTGLGLMLALTTVVLWAMLPIALKIVLGGMDALTLTWYRFVAAAIVLGVLLAARGTLPGLRALGRPTWLLLAVAVVCLSANYALYVLGLDLTNASTAQVVIQIAPVLLAVGGVWVFKERFDWIQRLGLVVMVGGLIVFSRDQIANLLADISSFYNGVFMIVAAAVAWAAYGLAQKQLLNTMSSPSVMLCVYIGGAVIFAPMAKPAGVTELTPAQLGALAFCIANMLIAYGTFAESLGHLEASRVSAVLAIVPLCTLAIIRLVENVMPRLMAPEPTSWVGLAGACMVVGGALMISVTRGRAA
jgi:drug/metabolite transporter (DMT)-like permease